MILNKANKNSPFKVPKDYFKNFDTDFFYNALLAFYRLTLLSHLI